MTAGYNIKGRVWRFFANNDDDQGGNVPSGIVMYEPVFARIHSEPPTIQFLEQGLETPEIFTTRLTYTPFSPTGAFDVHHNDQYEVTWPPISSFYGKKFVIIGIQHTSFDDSRRYLQVTLRREEIANPNNLQA